MTKRLRGELMTCEDVVATGRYPYTGRFGVLRAEDHAAVQKAMELVPEVEARLVALICCALACLAAGAFSPRPEQGRALGGAMTWAVWAIGYLILKAAVGAQIFCAATGVTLLTTLAAAIAGSCIFHKKLRNRTKKKKRKQKRNYAL